MENTALLATAAEKYRLRLCRVLEYIHAHLEDALTLERLSGIAAFSKYHFHRQFSEFFGIGVYRYVQLCRMKRASFQLAFRDDLQILEIALGSGYEGPEAFARAFRKSLGQTPSEFRRAPQWETWHATYQFFSELRTQHMTADIRADAVRILDFPETRVAALEHRGDPRQIFVSIRRFMEWRRQNHLPPRVSATYNVFHDDPATVDPRSYRMDVCCATGGDVAPNPQGVIAKCLPAGRCAVLRHTGPDDTLGRSIAYLYSEWLPASGEELRDFPLFCQRVVFFPDVPEHEALTDLFLPLR